MKTRFPLIARAGFLALALGAAVSLTRASETMDQLRKSAEEEIGVVDTQALFKRAELTQKYIAALDSLEKTLAAAGQLDAIVNLRAEREQVRKSGETTSHQDKALVDLRAKYLKSLEEIDAGMKVSKGKVAEGISKKIREQESVLTKAGKVDEALALRKQGEKLMAELSAGNAAGAAADSFKDDPRISGNVRLKPMEPIDVPEEKPAVFKNPFAIEGRWMESMTVPVERQRIGAPIIIGDRGKKVWPLVVVSPGSAWAGGNQGRVELSAARFVADRCRFQEMELGADQACLYFFRNSSFKDCRFAKVGIWYGGDQAAKFFLENCVVRGSFSGTLNIVDHGFRVQSSVLEGIKLPSMLYKKPGNDRPHQPTELVNHKWMRIVHSRFVKCEIPLSFLLLTRECVFENCVFVDDDEDKQPEISKPIEVTMYTSSCQMKIRKLPPAVTLAQHQPGELKEVTVPTAAMLEATIR